MFDNLYFSDVATIRAYLGAIKKIRKKIAKQTSQLTNGGGNKSKVKRKKNPDRALQAVKRDLGWSSEDENENKWKHCLIC